MLSYSYIKLTEKKGLSERFEATAALINSTFARETARKNLPVNIITWMQSHKCFPWILFFFLAVCTGSFGSLSALKDGNLCKSRVARIKTLHSHALDFY